jgi:hypothetical protein
MQDCMDNPINIWFSKEHDKLVRKEPNILNLYLRTGIVLMVLAKDIDTKYEYALQISLQQGHYQTKLHRL